MRRGGVMDGGGNAAAVQDEPDGPVRMPRYGVDMGWKFLEVDLILENAGTVRHGEV